MSIPQLYHLEAIDDRSCAASFIKGGEVYSCHFSVDTRHPVRGLTALTITPDIFFNDLDMGAREQRAICKAVMTFLDAYALGMAL